MAKEAYWDQRYIPSLAIPDNVLPTRVRACRLESSYPTRPITLTVGYPRGGGTDTLARLLAQHLADQLSQKIVIENKPGAASNIAAESVVHAKPDGYTLYISTRSNTIHKSMYGHFDFDMANDLAPIGVLAKVPNVLVTAMSSSISTVADLIALAKAHPGGVAYGSSGIGSDSHLLGELLQQSTQMELRHVPYRGGAEAITDVLNGRIDLLICALPGSLPYIKAGSVQAIASISRARIPTIEGTPTVIEAGIRDVHLETWFGLMAPAQTPRHVIAKLNGAVNAVLMKPRLRETLGAQGYAVPLQLNASAMS